MTQDSKLITNCILPVNISTSVLKTKKIKYLRQPQFNTASIFARHDTRPKTQHLTNCILTDNNSRIALQTRKLNFKTQQFNTASIKAKKDKWGL